MEVLVEFDYIAQNIDELDIKKGDRIRNVIQKEEGWYEGELLSSGKKGLFPDNFVKVLKVTPPSIIPKNLPYPPAFNKNTKSSDNFKHQNNFLTTSPPPPPPPSILNQLHQQQQHKQTMHSNKLPNPSNGKQVKSTSPIVHSNQAHNEHASNSFKARVLYSYIPVNEDELAIQENEIVEVLRLIEDGWYEGIYAGKQGVFPSNYVEKMAAESHQNNEVTNTSQSNESLNNIAYENQDMNDLDKKKNKKVLGIGFGNIFSGKTIELKTKENFTNQKGTLSMDQNERFNERNSERQISDSLAHNENDKNTRIKAKVLYEYVPTQPDELHLKVGQYLYILDKNLDDEGWYRGESIPSGEIGVFPDNFVEEIEDVSVKLESISKKSHSNRNPASLSNECLASENNQNAYSLTNSTVSNSSSNNSLTKLTPVNKYPTLNQNQAQSSSINNNTLTQNNSKSQSEINEDLDELNSNSPTNKLTHMKKTKQLNKRPPSFRKKKLIEANESAPMSPSKENIETKTRGSNEIEEQSPRQVANEPKLARTSDIEDAKKAIDDNQEEMKSSKKSVSPVQQPTSVPVIVSSPITCQQSHMPSISQSGMNRPSSNLSHGTTSDMSMATAVTNLDITSPTHMNSSLKLTDEIKTLKEELFVVKNENKGIKSELENFKHLHEDQMKKMQRKLTDLIMEIDDEKKTRLALTVELERLKKTIMNNL